MYLAQISEPYIGIGKQVMWEAAIYALATDTKERARAVVRGLCGPKDPDVVRELLAQTNRTEDEYFDIVLYRVPSRYVAVRIPEPNTGLPRPHSSYRI